MGNCASVKNDINLDQAKHLADLQQNDKFAFALNVLNMSANKKQFGKYTNEQVKALVANLLESNKDKLIQPIVPVVEQAKQEVVPEVAPEAIQQEVIQQVHEQAVQNEPEQKQE